MVGAVLPIKPLLGNLTDVDFGVEVGGKRLVVVARVAVHDVEVVNLLEVVLRRISGEDRGYARVEAAAEQRAETCFLETLAVCPLP